MFFRRFVLILSGLLIVLAGLVACGSAKPTATPLTATPNSATSTPTSIPPRSLTVCLGQEPASLFPVNNPSSSARAVLAANAPWVHVRHYGGFIAWDSEEVKIDSIQISGNELHLDSNAKNNIHHLRMTLPAGEEFRAICNEMVCSLRWKSVQKNFEFFDESTNLFF